MIDKTQINVGYKFGRLVVVSLNKEKSTPKHKYWNCICDCGNNKTIRQDHLKNLKYPSCGCYRKEIIRQAKKENIFKEAKDYYIMYSSNTGSEFIIDKEDYEKVRLRCWYEDNHGYAKTRIDGKLKSLHRYIMDVEYENILIDHINRNPKDNRKQNLRHASKSENGMNRLEPKSNKSGFRGVFYREDKKRWQVKIKNKMEYCKSYEEAVQRRIELENEIYGEFAPR